MLAAFLDLVDNPIVKIGGALFAAAYFFGPIVWRIFKDCMFAVQDFRKEYRKRGDGDGQVMNSS